MDSLPTTHGAAGEPRSTKSTALETGAAMVQDFAPVQSICAHLNAFHVYASEPSICVEANHYCTHLNEDVRQCLIYDSLTKNARLIGIEYMITPKIFHALPADERKLWHSHVYEVKSGQLIMPQPSTSVLPAAAWEVAETKEMEQVIGLYGKTYHFWRVERGDLVPMGAPELMGSLTGEGQMGNEEVVIRERDGRFGTDSMGKRGMRGYIVEPEVHPDADQVWKQNIT